MVCIQMKLYTHVTPRSSSDLSLLAILVTKGRTALLKDMEGKEYVRESENHACFIVQCTMHNLLKPSFWSQMIAKGLYIVNEVD